MRPHPSGGAKQATLFEVSREGRRVDPRLESIEGGRENHRAGADVLVREADDARPTAKRRRAAGKLDLEANLRILGKRLVALESHATDREIVDVPVEHQIVLGANPDG